VSKVYLIGAGPGDPDLLTVKAERILRQVDVVLYDRLVGPEVLLLAKPEAELIYAGKQEGEQENMQQVIFDLMLSYARAGKTVARVYPRRWPPRRWPAFLSPSAVWRAASPS
jgi:uroporphyrin-III C-methyltransferase